MRRMRVGCDSVVVALRLFVVCLGKHEVKDAQTTLTGRSHSFARKHIENQVEIKCYAQQNQNRMACSTEDC